MDWKNEHPQYHFGSIEDKHLMSSHWNTPWNVWDTWLRNASIVKQYTNEVAIATAGLDGQVSVRIVLLKYGNSQKGFCWFTNKKSEKGLQLLHNPRAEILWFCREQQRQVRIRGSVVELSRDEVIAYAHSRPLKSQISALISKQSSVVSSKQVLTEQFNEAFSTFAESGVEIPVSEDWTGFALNAIRFEFWQGNTNRLHDRIVFSKADDGWSKSRLYP